MLGDSTRPLAAWLGDSGVSAAPASEFIVSLYANKSPPFFSLSYGEVRGLTALKYRNIVSSRPIFGFYQSPTGA